MAQLTGAKINVFSEKTLAISQGGRGTVAIALPLEWYLEGRVMELYSEDSLFNYLGCNVDDIWQVREIFKRASKLLLYPLNANGSAAKVDIGDKVIAVAQKQGSIGNKITVKVSLEGELYRVKTFVEDRLVDSQLVGNATSFKGNDFIEISGTGDFVEGEFSLVGGNSGDALATGYDDFLEVLKAFDFQAIAYTGAENSIKQKLVAYAKKQREDEDKFFVVCIGDTQADYEGVVSFGNGVVLGDGSKLDCNEVSAWLAGATARAAINESLTYDSYDDAVDVFPRLTKSQQLVLKNKGIGCFIFNNLKAKVESDINTLVSFSTTKGQDFAKNRVVRVLDAICTDIKAVFDSSFAGKEDNNKNGRNRFKASICDYMTALQQQNAIEEFSSEDVSVAAGVTKDSVVVQLRVMPVDSMEKAEITILVR